MDCQLTSFSIYELKLARRRLEDAWSQGMLSSSESLMAIHILTEMIGVMESATYEQVLEVRRSAAQGVRLDSDG